MLTFQSSQARLRSCARPETACGKSGSVRNSLSSTSFSPKQQSAAASMQMKGAESILPFRPRLDHPARLCPTKPVRSQSGKNPKSFCILSSLLRVPMRTTCLQKLPLPRCRSSPFSKRTLVAAPALRHVRRGRQKRRLTTRPYRSPGGNTRSAVTDHRNCSLSSRRRSLSQFRRVDRARHLLTRRCRLLRYQQALDTQQSIPYMASSKMERSTNTIRRRRRCRPRSDWHTPFRKRRKPRRRTRSRNNSFRSRPTMAPVLLESRKKLERAKRTGSGKQHAAALLTESTRSNRRRKTTSVCSRSRQVRLRGLKILSGHRRS